MNLCINPFCLNPRNARQDQYCNQCGSDLLIDKRYRVSRILGEGGFAKVYEANDLLGKTVALKVQPHNSPKHLELFLREVRALQEIESPGIPKLELNPYIKLLCPGQREPLHCLVMEKISGLDLKTYIRKSCKPISQTLAVRWLIQLLDILQVVHSHHFIHRDIKPTNIMLRPDGHLVLIDFGAVCSIRNKNALSLNDGDTRISCELYTASEQRLGNSVISSDLYSLGRTFIYLLTGQELTDLYSRDSGVLSWHREVPELDEELRNYLERTTEEEERYRARDVSKLSESLKQLEKRLGRVREASELAREPPEVEKSSKSVKRAISLSRLMESERKLIEILGPVGSIVHQRALQKEPHPSEETLIEKITEQMYHPAHIEAYRASIATSINER